MASRASRYVPVEPASLERRDSRRTPVLVSDATVRPHATAPLAAALRDLSTFGCRIASPGEHQAGDRVWLRLAGGLPVAATVVWSGDGHTGCRFDAPLPRETVRGLTLGIA